MELDTQYALFPNVSVTLQCNEKHSNDSRVAKP